MYPINPFKKDANSGTIGTVGGSSDTFVSAASSFHPGGANFLFGDGSVRFLKESIDLKGVYWALSTRNGCEVVGADSY